MQSKPQHQNPHWIWSPRITNSKAHNQSKATRVPLQIKYSCKLHDVLPSRMMGGAWKPLCSFVLSRPNSSHVGVVSQFVSCSSRHDQMACITKLWTKGDILAILLLSCSTNSLQGPPLFFPSFSVADWLLAVASPLELGSAQQYFTESQQ